MVARVSNKLNIVLEQCLHSITYRSETMFEIFQDSKFKCSQNSLEQSCDRVLFHSIIVLKIRSTPNSKWSSPRASTMPGFFLAKRRNCVGEGQYQ